jgi:hypothetical protein
VRITEEVGLMSGFTYVDIFDTKGIEYLLVIVFLVAFVFFMRALTADSPKPRGTDEVERNEKTN